MDEKLSITYKDKEIENKLARALCIIFAVPIVGFLLVAVVAMMLIAIPLMCLMAIISLPLHLALIAAGRRGFVEHTDDGGLSYSVASKGFERKPHSR